MLRKGLGAFEMVTKTFVFEGNDYPLEKNLDFSDFFLSFVPDIKDKNIRSICYEPDSLKRPKFRVHRRFWQMLTP